MGDSGETSIPRPVRSITGHCGTVVIGKVDGVCVKGDIGESDKVPEDAACGEVGGEGVLDGWV